MATLDKELLNSLTQASEKAPSRVARFELPKLSETSYDYDLWQASKPSVWSSLALDAPVHIKLNHRQIDLKNDEEIICEILNAYREDISADPFLNFLLRKGLESSRAKANHSAAVGHSINFFQLAPGETMASFDVYDQSGLSYSFAQVPENAKFISYDLLSDGRLSSNSDADLPDKDLAEKEVIHRHRSFVQLTGQQATCLSFGLNLGVGKNKSEWMGKIRHIAPETFTEQRFKGVVTDQSNSFFSGKIVVDSEAQLTEADQLNQNILLSERARARGLPQLEIFADDVKCAHGQTTGGLSGDELFYLESRSIAPLTAKRLILQAKLRESLYNEELQAQVEMNTELKSKLASANQIIDGFLERILQQDKLPQNKLQNEGK